MAAPRTDEIMNHHQRISALFQEALARAPETRDDFLHEACAGDVALLREVESLLASHDDAGDFLEESAFDLARPALVGQRLGPYRVVKEIGQGGMGTVFLAERDDGHFQMQVAIKVIKRGMDTDTIIRRFQHERQLLAALEHPNIARMIDGGTTPDGRPYFVMEYIDGRPIDDCCRDLAVPERLQLFRVVCEALQHAHRHLIVHRDLKASNVIVTKQGVPKLLDFGLAKLLDADDESGTTMTVQALTPEYASPEQARGEAVTTASDVYSLGVLLYELLAGQRPYQIAERSHAEIVRVVTTTEPRRPSTIEARFQRQLRGDLDTIVLKAMHKDAQRRYASVEAFSEDIRRHLEGLPVTARPDTLAYRASKFVRRNALGVAAAAVVLLSLIGGFGVATWQARVARAERAHAERRFNEVRELATSFLFELHDAIDPLPGSAPVRGLLVTRALKSLDGLAREAHDDPALQRELAAAYERVGRVQGNSYQSNLGDTEGALKSYERSLALRAELARGQPDDVAIRDELASGYEGVADILAAEGDLTKAMANYERALTARRAVVAAQPVNPLYREELAELYHKIGDSKGMDGYANLGDVPGALASYRESVRLREELYRTAPQDAAYRAALANSLMSLGYLSGTIGDSATAIRDVGKSVQLLEANWKAEPNNQTRLMQLLSGYMHFRQPLADAGRLQEAIDTDRKTIALLQPLVASAPKETLNRRNLGVAYNYLGRDLRAAGRTAEAVGEHRKALDISQTLASADPRSAEHRHDVAITHYWLAEALADVKEDAGALREYRHSASAKEELRVSEPSNTRHGDDLALIYAGIGNVLLRQGNATGALEMSHKALPLAEAAVKRSATNQKARTSLALRYLEAGRIQAALSHWSEARALNQKSLAIWQDLRTRGMLIAPHAGKPAEAAREIARCDAALT